MHETAIRTAMLKTVPLTIKVYAQKWTPYEILFALLFGLICGIAAGTLSFYILTIRLHQERDPFSHQSTVSSMWCISRL